MPNVDIPENWTFKSKNIAENFDDHVREQLPWYDLVYDAVEHIVCSYLPENGLIYDIGASIGSMEKKLSNIIKKRNAHYIGIENSSEMIAKSGSENILLFDAIEYDYIDFDIAILFLSIMFMPVSKRNDLIFKLRGLLKKGGALIIVDKCVPHDSYAAHIMSKFNLRAKLNNGVAYEDILKKEMSLVGVQRPIHRGMFLDYGHDFFRLGDFSGWIIEN